jgi:hypothetical protein
MTDLVARLLDKIEEFEFAAKTAVANEGGGRWVSNGEVLFAVRRDGGECPVAASVTEAGWAEETGAHLTINDPDSVLRLCRAHRDIIERHAETPVAPGRRETTCVECGSVSGWPCPTLRDLARGLGVEETTDGN